jgi:hypothetical protein
MTPIKPPAASEEDANMDRIALPSSYHRQIGRPLLILAALALPGCATYRTVPGDAVAPSEELRIPFSPPRTLVVHGLNGDSTTVEEVTELLGKVVERSADMITLEVSRAHTAGSRAVQRFGRGAVVSVPVQEVEIREAQAGRTALLVLGLLGAFLAIIAVATHDSSPPPPSNKSEPAKY